MSTFLRFHLGLSLFILASQHSLVVAADPDVTLRQVVIRAPELQVLTAMMANPEDDALARILWAWVDDGTAKIVSDLSAPYANKDRVVARSGKQFKWVTEIDQDFEKGMLIPTGWTDVFVGTSLEAEVDGPPIYKNNPRIVASWNASFSPRDPQQVPWPTWWPDIQKPTVNWYPQQDFYVEKVVTAGQFLPQSTVILGVMPRADRFEVDQQGVKTLDVVVAQVKPIALSELPDKRADLPMGYHSRFTVLGFGLKDREALELLQRVDLERDQVLLDELLKQTAAGKVPLRTCSMVSQLSGQRARLESSREHSYPTEMPTIPSAWEMRPVGTILETDYVFPGYMNIAFELHPALPRRAEWRCALDSPALIMWQPQFIVRGIQTALSFGREGVAFLGTMRTPDHLKDMNGVIPGETLMLFAKLDESAPHPGPDPLKGEPFDNAKPGYPDPPSRGLELEAVVFEVSAKEAASWNLDPARFDDGDRFTQLMARAKSATAKIAAHVAVATRPGQRSTVTTVEEVITVTEVDPPQDEWLGRYRPTAMNMIPCGTVWEADFTIDASKDPFDHGAPEVHLTHKLQHHVAPPLEPAYQAMIDVSRKTMGRTVPEVILYEETWEGKVTLKPGKVRFIGLKHPPGEAFKDKLHLAFLRVRGEVSL